MKAKLRWVAVGIVLTAVAAGTAYAVAPDIPRGLRVLGIAIGGMSKTEAAQALRAGLAGRVGEPLRVRLSADGEVSRVAGRKPDISDSSLSDGRVEIRPGEVGLSIDVPATVERAAARGVLSAMWTGRDVEPVVAVDKGRLGKALKAMTDRLGTPMSPPRIRYEGLAAKAFYGVPGKGLDFEKAAEAAGRSWLRAPEVVLSIEDVLPASDDAEVDRVLAGLAVPAVAAPVRVRTTAGDLMLRPEQIAASLVIDSDESGKLTPHVDGALLRAAMKAELDAFEVRARDAGVVDGLLAGSEDGMRLDTEGLAGALMAVLPRAGERVVEGAVETVLPERSSAELAALGIKEQVSTFTTHFAGGPGSPRSDNILLGAKKIDGVVVEPGETFSLNGVTGPRGYAQGYRDAPVIVNGRLGMGVGGGLSQLATTLFNAAYYAGMVDVEHRPHTIYFPNYPPVIEATIFYPSLDLKFRNGTGFGVLVDTSWTDDSITVSLWSTKVYESVTTMWEPKRDFTEPGVVSVPAGTDCIERQGAPGFAQDAWRILKKRGEQVKREKFSWRYDAEPRVTCA